MKILPAVASLSLTLLSVASLAAAPSEASSRRVVEPESAAARQAIDQIYERFSAAYDTLDPAAVAALYTEDALYLGPGGDIRRGREAIRASFDRMFGQAREKGDSLSISFRFVERSIGQGLAYDVGYYDFTRRGADGETWTSRGKFVVVARPGEDGVWRFHIDSYSDVPEE